MKVQIKFHMCLCVNIRFGLTIFEHKRFMFNTIVRTMVGQGTTIWGSLNIRDVGKTGCMRIFRRNAFFTVTENIAKYRRQNIISIELD